MAYNPNYQCDTRLNRCGHCAACKRTVAPTAYNRTPEQDASRYNERYMCDSLTNRCGYCSVCKRTRS